MHAGGHWTTYGFVDLLIESNPPRIYFTVLEVKNMQIDYLVLRGSRTGKGEAAFCHVFDANPQAWVESEYHPPTMEKWLEGDVIRKQLRSYVTVRAKEKVRAYMVVIIGSRHILIREVDGEGEWTGNWKFVGGEDMEDDFEEVEAPSKKTPAKNLRRRKLGRHNGMGVCRRGGGWRGRRH